MPTEANGEAGLQYLAILKQHGLDSEQATAFVTSRSSDLPFVKEAGIIRQLFWHTLDHDNSK